MEQNSSTPGGGTTQDLRARSVCGGDRNTHPAVMRETLPKQRKAKSPRPRRISRPACIYSLRHLRFILDLPAVDQARQSQ
eukprot:767876-Hanusia_phi.AAC.9